MPSGLSRSWFGLAPKPGSIAFSVEPALALTLGSPCAGVIPATAHP